MSVGCLRVYRQQVGACQGLAATLGKANKWQPASGHIGASHSVRICISHEHGVTMFEHLTQMRRTCPPRAIRQGLIDGSAHELKRTERLLSTPQARPSSFISRTFQQALHTRMQGQAHQAELHLR